MDHRRFLAWARGGGFTHGLVGRTSLMASAEKNTRRTIARANDNF
jgi:hypothetical protein